MDAYIDKMLLNLLPEFDGEAATPAANHLFSMNDSVKPLDKEKAQAAHHDIAKLIFLYQCAQPNIQTSMAFLSTRVKSPAEDDWKKHIRVMRYLHTTCDLPLMLEADSLNRMQWWINASFAVHPDMRSHSRGVIIDGERSCVFQLNQQKLNTKSSTEAELVVLNDLMLHVIWT
eukprot:2895884-Ditylum_brightwellii.AAC.1